MTALTGRNDEELLALLQHANVAALEELYDRHHRLALAVAFRVLDDRGEAEEVVQEAFLAVWRRSATYRPERGGARGWILSIVRHRAIDRARRARGAAPTAALDETLQDDRGGDVFQAANRHVERERIQAAMSSLPHEQRETVELAYFAGLTQQEISGRVGVPLGTVKGRMRLAMEKLRVVLADLATEVGGGG